MNLSTRIEVSKPVKIGLLLGCLILLWLWYISAGDQGSPHPVASDTAETADHPAAAVEAPVTSPPEPKLRVDVYYECLCPDSRYFVLNHLQPTAAKLGSMMEVKMWPYGKATSTSMDKDYSFDCQHGPTECEGNIYHACVAKYVTEQDKQIEMLSCMINDNMEPQAVFRSCAAKLDIAPDRIEFCATSPEGRKLHYIAGTMTDKLSPPVSFIPTIEIDGSQHSQKAILKNFKGEVCRIYAEKYLQPGQKIANCSE